MTSTTPTPIKNFHLTAKAVEDKKYLKAYGPRPKPEPLSPFEAGLGISIIQGYRTWKGLCLE